MVESFEEALEGADDQDLIDQLYSQNQNLRNELDAERTSRRRAIEVIETVTREEIAGLVIPPVPKRKKSEGKSTSEEVAVPWIADLQLGKVTPTYNSQIAEERMLLYGQKTVDLIELNRNHAPINKAHIWILGDVVEGEDIFSGQQWLIDSSLYRQAMRNGPQILSTYIRTVLAAVDQVKVVAVIGNHGRQGKKGQYHPETNTDRMCYFVTKTLLQDEIDAGRLEWELVEPGNTGERGWHTVDHIGNYSSLLVHGDQFKGQLGIPWYGIRKKVEGWKTMGSDPELPFPPFKDVAFGHWHQPVTWTINGIGVRGCGSPESWNDYAAENFAGMSRPSQRLMFVQPEKGNVTAEYPEIWLD